MTSLNAKVDQKVAEMKKADTDPFSFGSIFGTSSLFGGSSLFPSGSLFATPSSTPTTTTTGTSTSPFGSSSLFGDSPLFSSSYTPSFSISTEKPKPKPEDQKDFDAKVNKIMAEMTKKDEEARKNPDSGGSLNSLFGQSLFASSSLFAASPLLSKTQAPATDSNSQKQFETRMNDTLGGNSTYKTTSALPTTTTSPLGSSFSSSLFGNSPLFFIQFFICNNSGYTASKN